MSIFNFDSETKEDTRRTILAVVLSTVIVGVGFMVQNVLFPPAPIDQTAQTAAQTTQVTGAVPGTASGSPATSGITVQPAGTAATAALPATAGAEAVPAPATEATYTIETDLLRAELTNSGGDIVSLKLKKHKDRTGYVDLIVPGSKGSEGLSVSFGPQNAAPVKDLMNVTWLDPEHKTIQFSRTFYAKTSATSDPVPFTYKKVFTFRDNEYMFGMAVTLENSVNENLPLNVNGSAYTIQVGPQIGPRFDHLSKNADYRKYILEVDGKKKAETPKAGNLQVIKDSASWAAIAGKYFTLIAIPSAPFASFSFLQAQDPDIQQTNTMFITRPAITASRQTDTYYFYFGPKVSSELAKYEYADKNSFGLSSMRLEDATERSNILGWLEAILKFFLNFFYKLIPNYGVAIIFVTIFIKALFFPLTRKSALSTARMQELQPKMMELQTKYKDNPQKLNQEMAEFYKRENYNPMSGCLPTLIQIPFFFAMYNLFNNHFDLRGASFIPGWINDLSLPDSILNFGNFRLPLLGWTDLRALPIIYLASQLLYGKFTQTPQTGQNASQMKLMMYAMPIMFFFVLYDVPAGLLIYWIISNLITIVQQIVINDILKNRKHTAAVAAAAAGAGGPVLARSPSGAQTMKSAGKATVRSENARGGGDFGDKVKNWLETQAKQAEKTPPKSAKKGSSSGPKSGSKGAKGKTGKSSKKS